MQQEVMSESRLANFPVSFFSMVMGLAGLTIAWEKAQQLMEVDFGTNSWMLGLTGLVFLVLLVLYGSKVLRYRAAVAAELAHPVKLNFFPAISISLLLLSIASLSVNSEVSRALWWVGAAMHLLFTLYVVNVWMHHQHFEVHHMNPAWFIPAVGNVLVPVAGVSLGYVEIAWFFFSIGMMFWVILMTIIFYRILFHNPIDQKLLPTLFILIAPPAVGFIAYVRLVGELDSFARILYYSGLFLLMVLLTQGPRFAKLEFFLSWWAYSFPLAAISIASQIMYEQSGAAFHAWVGGLLLLALTFVVVILVVRTASAIVHRRICVPGH